MFSDHNWHIGISNGNTESLIVQIILLHYILNLCTCAFNTFLLIVFLKAHSAHTGNNVYQPLYTLIVFIHSAHTGNNVYEPLYTLIVFIHSAHTGNNAYQPLYMPHTIPPYYLSTHG